MPERDGTYRDARFDFARGVALLIIFSDHVAGNVLTSFTPVAYGLSDMAEVFIFTSGYVCGLTYGKRLRNSGFVNCLMRAWRRAGQVYAAMLVASVAMLTLAIVVGGPPIVTIVGDQWSIHDAQGAPFKTLCLLAACRIEIYPFFVLAIYIPLLLTLPLFLNAFRISPTLSLLASAFVYSMVQFYPALVSLPVTWQRVLFFNPFAWQLLFFTAASLGMLEPRTRASLRPNWLLAILAGGLLELSFLICLYAGESRIPWTGKSRLEWLRLLHFAAVTVVGWKLIPSSESLAKNKLCRPLILCGSSTLLVYCTASILGICGECLFRHFGNGWTLQAIVNIGGWSGCIAVAAFWRTIRNRARRC